MSLQSIAYELVKLFCSELYAWSNVIKVVSAQQKFVLPIRTWGMTLFAFDTATITTDK